MLISNTAAWRNWTEIFNWKKSHNPDKMYRSVHQAEQQNRPKKNFHFIWLDYNPKTWPHNNSSSWSKQSFQIFLLPSTVNVWNTLTARFYKKPLHHCWLHLLYTLFFFIFIFCNLFCYFLKLNWYSAFSTCKNLYLHLLSFCVKITVSIQKGSPNG